MEPKAGTRDLDRSKTASVSSRNTLTCLAAPPLPAPREQERHKQGLQLDHQKAAPGNSSVRPGCHKLT